jgi:flagellar motor switch protein FliM
MSASTGLLRFAAEGERVRRATSALEQTSPLLASAVKRSMPFLGSRGATVSLAFARAMPIGDIIGELQRPIHATRVVLAPGGASGAVVFDGGAISTALDGVLGGDGKSPPKLDPAGLTGPQTALMGRVVDGVVRSFSEILVKKFGFGLRSVAPDADDAITEGAPVACTLELGGTDPPGRVVLLLPKEALLSVTEARENPVHPTDPRVVAVLDQVELEVVAELARVKLSLGQLSRLKVGDTIRVDTPVGGKVSVRADGRVLLRGHPTTSGGQIAIRVVGGHEG